MKRCATLSCVIGKRFIKGTHALQFRGLDIKWPLCSPNSGMHIFCIVELRCASRLSSNISQCLQLDTQVELYIHTYGFSMTL